MEKKEPKFKVGDWVTIQGMSGNDRFHILEVIQQTCEAGIAQARYVGRHYFKSKLELADVAETEARWVMSIKELQLREIELGELIKMPN